MATIEEKIKAKGVTKGQVAKMVGIDPATLSRIISDYQKYISEDVIERIHFYLDNINTDDEDLWTRAKIKGNNNYAIIDGYYRDEPAPKIVLDQQGRVAEFETPKAAHDYCRQNKISDYRIVTLDYDLNGNQGRTDKLV